MILDYWNRLRRFPLGSCIFSCALRWMIPYTGSIRPQVLELGRGFARVKIRDRRAVRNHLHSIHAAALMNLAEAASGLAFISALPPDARAIVKGFSMEYLKKARGELTAESRCEAPRDNSTREYKIDAIVYDSEKAAVARGTATWLVGPKKEAA